MRFLLLRFKRFLRPEARGTRFVRYRYCFEVDRDYSRFVNEDRVCLDVDRIYAIYDAGDAVYVVYASRNKDYYRWFLAGSLPEGATLLKELKVEVPVCPVCGSLNVFVDADEMACNDCGASDFWVFKKVSLYKPKEFDWSDVIVGEPPSVEDVEFKRVDDLDEVGLRVFRELLRRYGFECVVCGKVDTELVGDESRPVLEFREFKRLAIGKRWDLSYGVGYAVIDGEECRGRLVVFTARYVSGYSWVVVRRTFACYLGEATDDDIRELVRLALSLEGDVLGAAFVATNNKDKVLSKLKDELQKRGKTIDEYPRLYKTLAKYAPESELTKELRRACRLLVERVVNEVRARIDDAVNTGDWNQVKEIAKRLYERLISYDVLSCEGVLSDEREFLGKVLDALMDGCLIRSDVKGYCGDLATVIGDLRRFMPKWADGVIITSERLCTYNLVKPGKMLELFTCYRAYPIKKSSYRDGEYYYSPSWRSFGVCCDGLVGKLLLGRELHDYQVVRSSDRYVVLRLV